MASKVYERLQERKLPSLTEHTLDDSQAGLRQLCEKTITKSETICACTIDMQTAFDSVDKESIWEILEKT